MLFNEKKIKQMDCVKKSSLSFKPSETQTEECKAAFNEFNIFKNINKKILTTTERFKLRHKTFGGLNSRFLSMILFNSIRNWNIADNASDNNSKHVSKQNLLKFFSSTDIELPKLTDDDKKTIKENTNTEIISEDVLKRNSDKVDRLISEISVDTSESSSGNTSESSSGNTPESSSVNTSENIPKREEHDYYNFLKIIGLNESDTISEAEFKLLVILDNTKSGGDAFENIIKDVFKFNGNLYNESPVAGFLYTIIFLIPALSFVVGLAIIANIYLWVYWFFTGINNITTEVSADKPHSWWFNSIKNKVNQMLIPLLIEYKELVSNYKDGVIQKAKEQQISDDIFDEYGGIKPKFYDSLKNSKPVNTFDKKYKELFKPINEYLYDSYYTTSGVNGKYITSVEMHELKLLIIKKYKQVFKDVIKPTLKGTIVES